MSLAIQPKNLFKKMVEFDAGLQFKKQREGIYVLFYSKMVKPFITHFLIGHLNYEN